MRFLIDTTFFIDIVKKDSPLVEIFQRHLLEGDELFLFCLVKYEILRGYHRAIFSKQGNEVQKDQERDRIRKFEQLTDKFHMIFLNDQHLINRAAEVYGDVESRGYSKIPDVDIFLIAIGQETGYTIVSNDEHVNELAKIYGLAAENWHKNT